MKCNSLFTTVPTRRELAAIIDIILDNVDSYADEAARDVSPDDRLDAATAIRFQEYRG